MDHPRQPWGQGDGCCGAAGMPCLLCNPQHDENGQALMPLDEEGQRIVPNLLYLPFARGLPDEEFR